MTNNPIKLKSYSLAIQIVELYKSLSRDKNEFVLSKQILKSGTSIGANIREAIQAESKADFIHKMCIAIKSSRQRT